MEVKTFFGLVLLLFLELCWGTFDLVLFGLSRGRFFMLLLDFHGRDLC